MAIVSSRSQKHREGLRLAGLRPFQIWVPDTKSPGFAQMCRQQSLLVAQADKLDADMDHFMDQALVDTDGWAE